MQLSVYVLKPGDVQPGGVGRMQPGGVGGPGAEDREGRGPYTRGSLPGPWAHRRLQFNEQAVERVRQIIGQVAAAGDQALRELSRQYDQRELPQPLAVPPEALAQAARQLDPELRQALELAISRVRRFHEQQKRRSWRLAEEAHPDADPSWLGQEIRPLRRVGIYVPGGRAAYPSSLIMAAVPAQVAGVQEIAVVSPPAPGGAGVHPLVAATAELLGLRELYPIGGAQAVAALALGTESIAPVDKVVGPGNLYVTLAKRELFGATGVDMLAGPSEVVIVADAAASPDLVAADLLSQAEHDEAAGCCLITPSLELAAQVQRSLEPLLQALPEGSRRRAEDSLSQWGAIYVVPDLEAAFCLANALAPEHLEIQVEDAEAWLNRVDRAGTVFLGPWSPEPMGDYVAGTNHILPTHGTARFASGLSVDDFVRRMTVVSLGPSRFRLLAGSVMRLAGEEGLPAHAASVRLRLGLGPQGQGPCAPRSAQTGQTAPALRSALERSATVQRSTRETDIRVELHLDGQRQLAIRTGIGFLDHLVEQLAFHAGWDLRLDARGDLQVDAHHLVEDTGMVLGQALREALGGKQGIARFGSAWIPMDEALAFCAVDLSGRGYLQYSAHLPPGQEQVGGLPLYLLPEFLRALAYTSGITLHLNLDRGANAHHMVEAGFKALGRALAQAAQRPAASSQARPADVPSTKGAL